MALILGLSSGEMACRQLVGIHETQLGSPGGNGGDGGALDHGSGGVSAADDGSGGGSSTSAGGSDGGIPSHSGGSSGSGGANATGGTGAAHASGGNGTGGRAAGGAGAGGPGTGGSQAGGTATGGADTGGSQAGGAGAGGAGGSPAKKTNGTACRMNADCVSNLCGAEWVCCNANCNGQCESCLTSSSLGTCVPVTTPRSPCDGSGTCGGVCNGVNRNACSYPSSTTICGEPTCINGSARAAATCDGHGACGSPAVMTCESGCSGSKCAPPCHHPSAANLLSNPGFDGSLSAWVLSSASYSSNDFDGCGSSGSAAVDTGGRISQCLPATAGVTYWVSFRFKVWGDAQTNDTYLGWCGLDYFPSANLDCSGTSTLAPSSGVSAPAAGAAWSTSVGGGAPAPAGTGRVSFYCTGERGRGFYDQLYLGTATAPNF